MKRRQVRLPRALNTSTPTPVVIEKARVQAEAMAHADAIIHGAGMLVSVMDRMEAPDVSTTFRYSKSKRKVLVLCIELTDQWPALFHRLYREINLASGRGPHYYEVPDGPPGDDVIDAEFEDEGADLQSLDEGVRLVDKDGDPWIITRHGARCLPDDPDRRVDWAFENLHQAEKVHGPFRIVPPAENTPDA